VSRAEGDLAAKAKKEFDDANYPLASADYNALVEKFPNSGKRAEYEFWAGFAEVRQAASSTDDPAATAAKMKKISDEQAGKPAGKKLLEENEKVCAEELNRVANARVAQIERQLPGENDRPDPAGVDRAEGVAKKAREFLEVLDRHKVPSVPQLKERLDKGDAPVPAGR